MDSKSKMQPVSINTLLQPTSHFKLDPKTLIIPFLGITMCNHIPQWKCPHTTHCIKCYNGNFESAISSTNNVSSIPVNTTFCFDTQYNGARILDNAENDSFLKWEINHSSTPREYCKCNFEVMIVPRDLQKANYTLKWCTERLYIRHPYPLEIKELSQSTFKDFTHLTIYDCSKLSSIKGALNALLELKELKHLTVQSTQLDNTIIDATHLKLEILNLKGCNCTEIKGILMPYLRCLILDDNPLERIDSKTIKTYFLCKITPTAKIKE